MKKYSLSKIMKRAWEIKKENTENIFSLCLEMAWDEEKGKESKKKFSGYVEMDSKANWGTMYSFSLWEKYGKRRIYCSYRNKKSAGHIDLDHDNAIVSDCAPYADAMREFIDTYKIA